METESNFLYEDLSYEIIGCAFDAFKTVGVGFDEIRYHKYFHQYLLDKNLHAQYKPPAHIDYLGHRIADLQIDEIIENKIIVELKCIQTSFPPENYAQIMTYLKVQNLRLGLLINFGLHMAYPNRVIFDERREKEIEQWDKGFFPNAAKSTLIDSVIASARNIDQILGPAYHSEIYQGAMVVELKNKKLEYDDKVEIVETESGFQFSPFKVDYWLISQTLLLGILAGKDKPGAYDLLRMRSYLRKLKLHHGLIAYWSAKNFQLYGFYEP